MIKNKVVVRKYKQIVRPLDMSSLLLLASAFVSAATLSPSLFATIEGITGEISFVKIDGKSGVKTMLSTMFQAQDQAQALSTVDNKNGVYYLLGSNGVQCNLVGLNLTSGAIVSKAVVPDFVELGWSIGIGQGIAWDPHSNLIIAAGQDKTASWKIGYVSPTTGVLQQKVYVTNTGNMYAGLYGASSVFNANTGDFVMQVGKGQEIPFIRANLGGGNFTEQANCHYTQAFVYDNSSQSMYGLGLINDTSVPGGLVTTLVQMKNDMSGCTVIGNVTGVYKELWSGVAAIDSENRILYFFAMPCAPAKDPKCRGNLPYDLIGIDLASAKTVSNVSAFCTPDASTCPWTLEFAHPTF